MHHKDTDKTYREKARQELPKNAISYMEQILETKQQVYGLLPPISKIIQIG